jgi:RIO kinase 1
MNDPLHALLADGVIDEIVSRLKSGKEADLWLVRHGGETVAAKVYKAREVRNFRNNAAYLEGRQVRNTRTQRAMDKGSRFGVEASEDAWKAKEADALHTLYAAGMRVPKPVLFYEGVLLMEVVVDAEGRPAPRLIDVHVPRDQADALYAQVRTQAIGMLCVDLIHGDLSPYNVLLGWDGPVVIDFPQVIGAAHNNQAPHFFTRDLESVRGYFAAIDPALRESHGDAEEIWRAYARRDLTPDFVPSGRPPPPPKHVHFKRRGDRPKPADRAPPRGPPPQQRQPQRGARPGPEVVRIQRVLQGRPNPPQGQTTGAQPTQTPQHHDRRRGRPGAPQPDVIRVQRPLPVPANPPPAAAPGRHRRRRRRRRS